MCGIAGIVHSDPTYRVGRDRLIAMRDELVHRGPDDYGVFLDDGIGLASRRLAILDLSPRGKMPMETADGRYVIVYNGEVYNFRELRPLLEAKGVRLTSDSDTEVVLNLFALEGPAMLDRLNGMFAIAIWDRVEQSLFLARDRVGVKPLVFARSGGEFLFASEAKALLAAGVEEALDDSTLEELLTFRYVAGARTPNRGIERLLPGHWLTWKNGSLETRRWWSLVDRARTVQDAVRQNPAAWYAEMFDDATRLQRISDVPVGVLLSGGLDSSSIATSLAQLGGGRTASFTVAFQSPGVDETRLARGVAAQASLEYHDMGVDDADLPTLLEEATRLNDAPLAHASDTHLLAISRFARPKVTVLLSGEGGDETLGGYNRYTPLRYPWLLSALRPAAPFAAGLLDASSRAHRLARLVARGGADAVELLGSCELLPEALQDVGLTLRNEFAYRSEVLAEAASLYPREPVRRAMYYDQHTYLSSLLDRNDRMTMGASIECRVPMLDHRIVEGLAAMPSPSLFPTTEQKSLLRRALGKRLPADVLAAKKWGFGVPWSAYLRRVPGLVAAVEALPDGELATSGRLDRAAVRRVVRAFLGGDDASGSLVRQLVMFEAWRSATRSSRPRASEALAASDPRS